MTDKMIELYATSKDPLPPLTRIERVFCLAQIRPPLRVLPNASDQALCQAVIASWARQAATAAMPAIREHLAVDYQQGDPETGEVTSPITKLIGGLLSKVGGLIRRR